MTTVTFTATDEQVIDAWAEQVSYEKLSEVYKKVSDMYANYIVDAQIAADLVQLVYDNYIKDNYTDDQIPDILKPLVIKALKQDIVKDRNLYNNEDKSLLSDASKKAIEFCDEFYKDVELITYSDLIDTFESGYNEADSKNKGKQISDFTDMELLNELKNRML